MAEIFSCGKQRVFPSGQDSSILLARVANHRAGFDQFILPARERSWPYDKFSFDVSVGYERNSKYARNGTTFSYRMR